ncbi:hypothetical protein AYO20_11282 [Fonsecaea nubica]|uniref:Uncharacterized protein n=1 Tax=Fonsecaea nubica TaxID=856822 RepID=A0A178BYF0_9EURO|nr:hypothetical protein AYO20_11282 [Fonsecaea nubica]OAL22046.1 hypothetical protein AYO20_11282 [Fonsecaea nubica]
MFFGSIIYFAGGLLLAVYAQSTPCACSNSTILINSLETLEAAQACTTAAGDIVIEYGEDLPPEIEFPVLETVEGSVLSLNFDENIPAWRFSAPRLNRVKDFYLSHWVNLTTIDMPLFDHADRIRLNDLPQLTTAHFLSTVSRIDFNYEIWNTSLTNITNNRLLYATFVEIFDNPKLETVELLALRNASYNIALRRNRPGLDVRLRDLKEVWHLELQQIASLTVPVLENVIGYFIVNASSLNTLSAPNLQTIGTWYDPHIVVTDNRGLIVTNNQVLDTLSFPQLKNVTLDLVIRNDTSLRNVHFPELHSVAGNVALEGQFTEITFPDLNRVGGEFSIGVGQSSAFCRPFQDLKENGSIRGDFSCPEFSEPTPRSQLDLDNMQEYIDEYLEWVITGQTNAGAIVTVPAFKGVLMVVACLGALFHAM